MRSGYNKYHARRVEMDGITFDSQKEANRYNDLKLMQAAGEIQDLKHHVAFPIDVNGMHVCDYEADFVYQTIGGLRIEDVKSTITRRLPAYRLKRKLMQAVHGIEIVEV